MKLQILLYTCKGKGAMELIDLAKQYTAIIRNEVEDNWLRGDIALMVTELYSEEKKKGKSDIINNFLGATGESRSAFNQYRWVAEAFSDDTTRHLPVTWTHYRICAGLDEPVTWLKKAHDEKWSCAKLIEEIKAAKLNKEIDEGLECWQCGKKVSKDKVATVTYKKRRRVLCSLNCLIELGKLLKGKMKHTL